MPKLKLYGERNSGTNYLSKLIHQNIDIEEIRGVVPKKKFWTYSEFNKNLFFKLTNRHNLGWKHTYVDLKNIERYRDIDQVKFITVTKNPYAYMLSLKRNPYHYIGVLPVSLEEFLKAKWHVQSRDNIRSKSFDNPIQLWNSKNDSYLKLKDAYPKQTLNLKYEDILANPLETVELICAHFNLKQNSEFVNCTKSTKSGKLTYDDYKDYYLKEKWRNELSEEAIYLINEHLDDGIMQAFGYRKI